MTESEIAYLDSTHGSLLYYEGNTSTDGQIEVVDEGIMPASKDLVGADCSLIVDKTGNPRIAYQDMTLNNLKYAIRRDGQWETLTLEDEGAIGYYIDQTVFNDLAFIATYELRFSEKFESKNSIHIFLYPITN